MRRDVDSIVTTAVAPSTAWICSGSTECRRRQIGVRRWLNHDGHAQRRRPAARSRGRLCGRRGGAGIAGRPPPRNGGRHAHATTTAATARAIGAAGKRSRGATTARDRRGVGEHARPDRRFRRERVALELVCGDEQVARRRLRTLQRPHDRLAPRRPPAPRRNRGRRECPEQRARAPRPRHPTPPPRRAPSRARGARPRRRCRRCRRVRQATRSTSSRRSSGAVRARRIHDSTASSASAASQSQRRSLSPSSRRSADGVRNRRRRRRSRPLAEPTVGDRHDLAALQIRHRAQSVRQRSQQQRREQISCRRRGRHEQTAA